MSRNPKQNDPCYGLSSFLAAASKRLVLLATPCALLWASSISSQAQSYPLPAWYIYGRGDVGTWDGSSTGPDKASLSVTIVPQPFLPLPGAQVNVSASSSAPVLVIEPRTTYTLTFAAARTGSANGGAVFLKDTASLAGLSLQGSGWKNYTNSFTTGGPSDPAVGRNLYVQLYLSGLYGVFGTTTASFTNIHLSVVLNRPTLRIRNTGSRKAEIRWPTNFTGCVPEFATRLPSDSWESLTTVPVLQGNEFVVPVQLGTDQTFFRLRQD